MENAYHTHTWYGEITSCLLENCCRLVVEHRAPVYFKMND